MKKTFYYALLLSISYSLSIMYAEGRGGKKTEIRSNVNITKNLDQYSLKKTNAAIFEDGAEGFANFEINLTPWTVENNDGEGAYVFTNYDFANEGHGSWMILNSASMDPSASGTTLDAKTGDKSFICVAGYDGAAAVVNDDWLITPALEIPAGGANLSFWAKSYTIEYGADRFEVLVSTTLNTGDFTKISEGDYIAAPVDWTEYNYDLSSYAGQTIYIAIRCVSNDSFVLMMDDFLVADIVTGVENKNNVPLTYTLSQNYPNPFNPTTNISFSIPKQNNVKIAVYDVLGNEISILVNKELPAGNHEIQFDGSQLSSGIYFYAIQTNNFSKTMKLMLMK